MEISGFLHTLLLFHSIYYYYYTSSYAVIIACDLNLHPSNELRALRILYTYPPIISYGRSTRYTVAVDVATAVYFNKPI